MQTKLVIYTIILLSLYLRLLITSKLLEIPDKIIIELLSGISTVNLYQDARTKFLAWHDGGKERQGVVFYEIKMANAAFKFF